jgi:glycosyltransferase involved in cell wall biosynthesis
MPDRHLLVFVLHSSNLYGTERMSFATAVGLRNEFDSIFLAPPGIAIEEAKRLGFGTGHYHTSPDLAWALRPIMREHKSFTLVATGPRYSLVCKALNIFYGRQVKHIQIVHGGAGEYRDFGRKKWLNPFDVTFVTVSDYARNKLIEHGVRRPIEVVPNFIPEKEIAAIPKRAPLERPPVKGLVVSRLVELKKIGLVLDALEGRPELADFPIEIVGDGPEKEALVARAGKFPNVHFAGFRSDAVELYAQSDLLIHTCPTEAFGVVILEAMAARLPVLVPDEGGTASLIEDNWTGFKYRANDPAHLAEKLVELRKADPARLNDIADNAAAEVAARFSEKASLEKYRRLFSPEA